MASKKSSDLPAGDDLLAELDQLAGGNADMAKKAKSANPKPAEKPVTASTNTVESDPLKELEGLARSRPQTPSKKTNPTAPPPRKSTESGRERDFHKGQTVVDNGADVSKRLENEAKKAEVDRKSTRLNSSHSGESRMPSSA